ncbi:Uncharacterised protein [Vibrio cholerae]|nr:Uncharacterised protein [Vibrio cholerae]
MDAINDMAQIVDQSFINIIKAKKKGKQKPMVNRK